MKLKNIKIFALVTVTSLALLTGGCIQKKSVEVEHEEEVEQPLEETEGGENMTAEQLKGPEVGEEVAIITTNHGEIKIKFFPEVAPKAVENFKTHSANGYYENVGFHRIIKDFMIQGGDPDGMGTGGESIWGKPFEDEFNPDFKHLKGTLSMANAGPRTNGSQFFIVHAENGTPHLNGKHTVFGQVYEGMDVVDKIANLEVDGRDMPEEPVVMEKIEIIEFK